MSAATKTRVCPECGAEFTPSYGTQVCCSDICKRNRKVRLDRSSRKRCWRDKNKHLSRDLRNFQNALEKTAPVSVEIIMKARKKPKGVSDVRWRIELRRRANKKRYSNGIFMAPSPDLLR